ncbi:DMT family transporter [Amycolatopsis nigrescens]|uniref:DMT family transporter n=1 Tax=Amycolatopsis nigrescens TaxID=381445 RepID=UPI00058D8C21|nr:DMT family transporter [Amycolatopsis nigrescens]
MSLSAGVRARKLSAVALVTAGVLWGTGGLAGSLLASKGNLHPLSVAAYRLLLGGLCMVLLLGVTGRLRGLPRTAAAGRRLFAAGALLAVFQAGYFASVLLTSVSVATMATIGSVPVFVAIGGALSGRGGPDRNTVLSIGFALLGLVLLSWSPEDGDQGRLVAGLALALLCGAGFAAMTLLVGKPVDGLDPLRTSAFGCLIGGFLLLPAALRSGMAIPLRADVLGVALYLGAVPTGLAYAAYFLGLRAARPVLAALSVLLEPLTAAVLAALVLGDELGVVGWCGAALLVVALAVSYRRPGSAADPQM